MGAGNYAGGYTVNQGGRFSPGNSPGTVASGPVTWGAGGTYVWEVNDVTGTAGVNWDLSQITGSLTIAAGTTPNSRFTIAAVSLTESNLPGLPAHFDPAQSYQWVIATASSGVTGFDPPKFAIDATQFASSGLFALTASGNSMILSFTPTPVPEPVGILAACAVAAGIWYQRRRPAREGI
jgi:hypothetical protein